MNPYDQYRRTRIMTASPGELLVMLYDGLLQRVGRARADFEQAQWTDAGEHLGRAQDIIHELMSSLDPDKAPELAENLLGLYAYSSRRLLEALATRDAGALDEVVLLLRPLRDAWAEANVVLRGEAPSARAVGE